MEIIATILTYKSVYHLYFYQLISKPTPTSFTGKALCISALTLNEVQWQGYSSFTLFCFK